MDRQDSRTPEGDRPQFSDHLLPALLAAAELGVETACDGDWDEENAQLENVCDAVHVLDALNDGTYTREQIAALAERAAAMQGEAMQSDAEANAASFPAPIGKAWPVTAAAAAVLKERACLTVDLTSLREEMSGDPT
jgi:hypothetical protein